eukprot:CAMPEP_0115031580 /NCGR_PEP_ID=MMETSP0216-20121206/38625_1 /TAXON_ID=223996 /ORGANISM="Protocruzia adherens, Strain Boccale" /LENGTH=175 /DNA_ID=CAMNT_0002409271 /DNA_START=67 /DNA_END=591 /DNA_ORIENTATION=+
MTNRLNYKRLTFDLCKEICIKNVVVEEKQAQFRLEIIRKKLRYGLEGLKEQLQKGQWKREARQKVTQFYIARAIKCFVGWKNWTIKKGRRIKILTGYMEEKVMRRCFEELIKNRYKSMVKKELKSISDRYFRKKKGNRYFENTCRGSEARCSWQEESQGVSSTKINSVCVPSLES